MKQFLRLITCAFLFFNSAGLLALTKEEPRPRPRALANCPAFVPCPTMPPTCVNDPNQTIICNLGVNCLQACDALIENLWISGCLYFQDCAEITFSAMEFSAVFDESCTGLILDPQAPPYRLSPAYHVFTSDIIYPGDPICSRQLVARRVPIIGIPSTADPEPAPAVDFCVPADFDAASAESVEVDICFFTHAAGPVDEGFVAFTVCYETKAQGVQGFGGAVTGSEVTGDIPVDNTPTAGAPLNHYVATACIPAGSGFDPGDQAALVIRRTDDGASFDLPIYISSISFRYPRRACLLPFNACP